MHHIIEDVPTKALERWRLQADAFEATCRVSWKCNRPTAYLLYDEVVASRRTGRTTGRMRYSCAEHALKHALKHSIDMPPSLAQFAVELARGAPEDKP